MDVLSGPAASVVRALSKVRGERVIHAKGRAFEGVLRLGGASLGVPLLDEPGEHRVVLRLSRAVGLPDRLPDALGLAVRVLDAHSPGQHQDLVLDTGAAPPVLRRLPLPARQVLRATYSSLLPYELAGRRWVLAALPVASAPATVSFRDLRVEDVRFRLCVASAHGPWQEVGLVQATADAEDGRGVRFSPFTTGGGIAPAGWLQAARRSSYDAAHVGRDA